MFLPYRAVTHATHRKWINWNLTKSEIVAILSVLAAAASYFATQWQVRIASAALQFQREQFKIQRDDDQRKARDQHEDDLRHEKQHAMEMNRTIQENERSAKAAEQSVALAQSALNMQREQFREAQRAWVVFKGINIGRKFELDKPGLFLALLTNPSSSVAQSLQAQGTVKIGDPVIKADLEVLEGKAYSGAHTDLGQHIDAQIPEYSIPISSALVDRITSGASTISYYGKYQYFDQFGQTHEDHWCAYFIYNPAVDQFGQADCKVSMESPHR